MVKSKRTNNVGRNGEGYGAGEKAGKIVLVGQTDVKRSVIAGEPLSIIVKWLILWPFWLPRTWRWLWRRGYCPIRGY